MKTLINFSVRGCSNAADCNNKGTCEGGICSCSARWDQADDCSSKYYTLIIDITNITNLKMVKQYSNANLMRIAMVKACVIMKHAFVILDGIQNLTAQVNEKH